MKTLKAPELVKWLDYLMSCYKFAEEIPVLEARNLSILALETMETEKLLPYFDYLTICNFPFDKCRQNMVKSLILRIMGTWPLYKLAFFLPKLMVYQVSDDKEIAYAASNLVLKIIEGLPAEERAKNIKPLMFCQRFFDLQDICKKKRLISDIKLEMFSETEITILMTLGSPLNKFNLNVQTVANALAIKIMSSWSSDKLAENLRYLIFQRDTEKERARAFKLVMSIDANRIEENLFGLLTMYKENDKAGKDNPGICRLINRLLLKISGEKLVSNVIAILNFYITTDSETKYLIKRLLFRVELPKYISQIRAIMELSASYQIAYFAFKIAAACPVEQVLPYWKYLSQYETGNEDLLKISEKIKKSIADYYDGKFDKRIVAKIKALVR
jgi:hypothetical protein